MNYCKTYKVPCPFALSENAPIPCIGSQKQCDAVRQITKQNEYKPLNAGKDEQ